MGYIYILTSPNGKSYIGQTIRTIEERFKKHQQKGSGCVAIYNAIQYHGWGNFEKDWYECPDDDLNFDEELLVREMETLAPKGYNLKEGGGNTGKPCEETRQKQSEAKLGEKNHWYGKKGEKHPMYGKMHTEETKQRMSEVRLGEKNHNYGKNMSEETKRKISEAQRGEKGNMYGKPHTEETKRKISEVQSGEKHPSSKRVYQFLDGMCIGSFGSTEEAGRHLKKIGSNIRKCANGVKGYKTAYGFKWSYTNVEKLVNM